MKTYKMGVLGAGNMGTAIAEGAVRAGMMQADEILMFNRTAEKRAEKAARGFAVTDAYQDVYTGCEWVVLGVKPQNFDEILPALAAAGALSAAVTATYTGALLQSLASVLLWRTSLVPVLFVLSSASCGIATAFLAASFVETRHPYRGPLVWLARIDGGIVVVEAGCLSAFVLLAFAGEETAAAARALAFGELAPVFWGVLAVCGLAVPLVLERFLTHGNSRTQLLWIAALLLVGGFALRWCIVGAGAYDVTQMPEALYGLSTFGLTG